MKLAILERPPRWHGTGARTDGGPWMCRMKGVFVPPANGDAKVVVSYREIDNALTEGVMAEAASTLAKIELYARD